MLYDKVKLTISGIQQQWSATQWSRKIQHWIKIQINQEIAQLTELVEKHIKIIITVSQV